jgi:hypothetical protein
MRIDESDLIRSGHPTALLDAAGFATPLKRS